MQNNEEQSNKVGLLIMVDANLRDNFKIATIKEQTTMADVVIDAIKKYVGED